MSQKRRGPGVPRADEVPFGIRALERGVEVEGVWVSRGNTPEPSIHNESRASSIWDFMPKKAAVHDLEKQVNAKQESENLVTPKNGYGSPDSVTSAKRPASASFPRSVSADNLSKTPAAHDGTTKPDPAKRVRSKHPPPSFAKYSGNPSLHRQSTAIRTSEGIEAVYRASTYLTPAMEGAAANHIHSQAVATAAVIRAQYRQPRRDS